jgi:hypothetical protein
MIENPNSKNKIFPKCGENLSNFEWDNAKGKATKTILLAHGWLKGS